MIKEKLRQELFDLLSVRFERLMTGKELGCSTSIDDGTYEGFLDADDNRFYLKLVAKTSGYKLHEISVTFVDDDNWIIASKSYHGGKVSASYYREDLFYDKDLGLPNEVLYSVIDAIRSEAQLIRIIRLVKDAIDEDLNWYFENLVDFIFSGTYLDSKFRTNTLSIGSAFTGHIELKCEFKGCEVDLTVRLFDKVTGVLLYMFQVLMSSKELGLVSILYAKDGVSVVNTTSIKGKQITSENIQECVGIVDDVSYKYALVDLITYSGF